MKKAGIMLLLILLLNMLSGCSMEEIEAQAYAVSLGIDLVNEDKIEVSVQVPTLNQSSGGGGEGGGGGEDSGSQGYTFSTAQGETLTQALEMLNAGMTRELNLTGVKSIVISEAMAQNEKFRRMLEELALAYRVYGAAEVIICAGTAKKFIAEQKTVIGLRLSQSTTISLRHYRETGYIPSAKAADVYYLSRSIYGDPVTVFAAIHTGENQQGDPGEDAYAGQLHQTGQNKNQYFGAALLADGLMVGKLSGVQTQLLNVLLGELKHFSWIVEKVPARITVSGSPEIKVDLSENQVRIYVKLKFDVMASQADLSVDALEMLMLQRLRQLTEYCQKCGCDPFGYAEYAMRQFENVEKWRAYNWRSRFPSAQINYEVEIEKRQL